MKSSWVRASRPSLPSWWMEWGEILPSEKSKMCSHQGQGGRAQSQLAQGSQHVTLGHLQEANPAVASAVAAFACQPCSCSSRRLCVLGRNNPPPRCGWWVSSRQACLPSCQLAEGVRATGFPGSPAASWKNHRRLTRMGSLSCQGDS